MVNIPTTLLTADLNQSEERGTDPQRSKRRIAQITPPTIGELAVMVYDLKEEIARLRKDVRAEGKRGEAEGKRGETETAMLNDMVEAYTGMATLTKEHHKKQTAQITKMMNEISNKLLAAIQCYPLYRETTKPATKATSSRPRTNDVSHSTDGDISEATTTRQGRTTSTKGRPTLNSRTPLPWNKVAGTTNPPSRVIR
ncbi:hypothetical protein GNI_117830 [Gregarina niphandrodes]|uniref:Uncharacterized protein n=1 Tax=Gregarina niphandrodes TaxID=110365 RepID=A0A023B2R2_GRENI|nr:hypothetical protein GNI_117830 [Gregarina niphandrodes]EZG55109.1 hypothetical protein GNI_117830 [Gregarina niphandrodes]|eukprot:XP_011131771.1 hypothetical protein GNI_117830 [Gregarina niphandrodes]